MHICAVYVKSQNLVFNIKSLHFYELSGALENFQLLTETRYLNIVFTPISSLQIPIIRVKIIITNKDAYQYHNASTTSKRCKEATAIAISYSIYSHDTKGCTNGMHRIY